MVPVPILFCGVENKALNRTQGELKRLQWYSEEEVT